jgi:hypothetical protein
MITTAARTNVTAATREPLPWRKIVATVLFFALVGFVLGTALAAATGAVVNTEGGSRGIAICQEPVQGGVYYNVDSHSFGAFQGCDF